MHTYVIYDIVKDRIRKKIADVCLDYGLKRIQYSSFPRRHQYHATAGIGRQTDRTTRQSGREDRNPQRVCKRLRQTNRLLRRLENEHTRQRHQTIFLLSTSGPPHLLHPGGSPDDPSDADRRGPTRSVERPRAA